MTKSMTEGKPLRLILEFAAPLFLGNLLQQFYNLVDAAIVGKYLGTQALAAVGSTSSVQFLVLGFCLGVCAGFSIPFATHFGANRLHAMRRSIFNAAVLAVCIAVILTLVTTLSTHKILHLLKTAEPYYGNAYKYLFILFLGIPFTIFYNFISGMLRAVGDSKTPFLFLSVSTVLNIVMDIVFIIVFNMGCAGAAIATVAAQGISAVSCFVYVMKKQPVLKLRSADLHINGKDMIKHFAMGIPMGLQYSITAIGTMYMQAAINGLGPVYTASFTASSKIKQIIFCPFDALATGVSVFCSQNIGAGRLDRARSGIKQGLAAAIGYGLVMGSIIFFFGRTMSMIFIDRSETAVLDASGQYLSCLGVLYWTLAILNTTRMSTQGLGFSGRAIFSGVAEMIARIFVVLVFVPRYGYWAICFCDQAAWVAASLYIAPMCFHCLSTVAKRMEKNKQQITGN
ncbi:MAG: MATE family efflux transporter [Oscillospiraceae bacterium]|nr:MATE family efflux transporter [Oscillospiraceae bacterium]MBQ4486068.1 MATE family efflux transporter [Oscillospiraceae bacterium]MCR5806164.1 MATE family efflux transporter [Oscillospiraceae bacterium]